MRGTVLYGPGDVRFEEREDPKIIEPTDAIIRTTAVCVCGSDLWPYRGIETFPGPQPMAEEQNGKKGQDHDPRALEGAGEGDGCVVKGADEQRPAEAGNNQAAQPLSIA